MARSVYLEDPNPTRTGFIGPGSSLIEAQFVSQIQQQQTDIDLFVAQQTQTLRLELEARQRTQTLSLVSALKQRDDEIVRMGKLNYVLQERVKSLYVENQILRDLAQTNEATANTLRLWIGSVTGACPVCDTVMNASVHVNMS
ncbi:hypothetical protein BRARA_I01873 [Brassica rapa]|uniref:Uncharacterized protein n=1 Tax=Brassica campestris TaxID=3711 RepID=A0A397XV00_BRACM|nr:hypothetical protein BRARA_I01873 [Brassica rapa]